MGSQKALAQRLRVAIVGYGIVGKRRHRYIDLNSNFEVAALCDLVPIPIGTQQTINYYSDFRELLAKEPLDALFVCVPNDIAAEVTGAALRRGLHVFCEKPPGRNVSDIMQVREIEAAHPNLKLKYGFNHRYHESVREALRIVESGELGRVLNLRGVYGKSAVATDKSEWRAKREIAGGGILLDQGIHMVDLMRLFAGEFKEFHSYIENSFWGYEVEDNAFALMKSETGVVAFLHSTATEWRHRFNLEITMSGGMVILSGILSGSKSYGQETLKVVFRENGRNGNPKEQLTSYKKDNSWRDEVDEFATCVIRNEKVVHGSSLDALKTMDMVYNIYLADNKWTRDFGISK